MTVLLDRLPALPAEVLARLRCCRGCDRFFADQTDAAVQIFCEEACWKRWKRRPRHSSRQPTIWGRGDSPGELRESPPKFYRSIL